jgi:hypothetical protein
MEHLAGIPELYFGGDMCASTINRVLGGFITSFSECVASYINNIAEYENYCASICLKLPLNCASGGFREQLNPWHLV